MKGIVLVLMAFAFLPACMPAGPQARQDAVIFPGSKAKDLLNQCSRDVPPIGENTWQPSWADIDRLESSLSAAIKARPEALKIADRHIPSDWQRQYVGLFRGGRRYIYGNFLMKGARSSAPPDLWRTAAIWVCDGGPLFFGVEYDVDARKFDQIDFNMSIGP